MFVNTLGPDFTTAVTSIEVGLSFGHPQLEFTTAWRSPGLRSVGVDHAGAQLIIRPGFVGFTCSAFTAPFAGFGLSHDWRSAALHDRVVRWFTNGCTLATALRRLVAACTKGGHVVRGGSPDQLRRLTEDLTAVGEYLQTGWAERVPVYLGLGPLVRG